LSIHWRRFGKLDLNEREAIVWISEKQRIKVSIDYADEEDILESFLSLDHFLQKRPEWARKLRLATNDEDLFVLFDDLQHRLQIQTASTN